MDAITCVSGCALQTAMEQKEVVGLPFPMCLLGSHSVVLFSLTRALSELKCKIQERQAEPELHCHN